MSQPAARRFRPAPVPTVIVVAALFVLLNLGFWQLRRNAETEARLAEVEVVLDGPPATAAELAGDPEALRWRQVDVTGAFEGEPVFVTGRVERGTPGLEIVQRFAVAGGPRILVNRGWIPLEGWATALPPAPAGETRIRGLALPIDGSPDLAPIPADEGAPERWPTGTRADITGCSQTSYSPYAAVARRLGPLDLALVVVEGESRRDGAPLNEGLPVTGFIARPKARPHLEYAGTWFSIAAALTGLWIYAGFRRGSVRSD